MLEFHGVAGDEGAGNFRAAESGTLHHDSGLLLSRRPRSGTGTCADDDRSETRAAAVESSGGRILERKVHASGRGGRQISQKQVQLSAGKYRASLHDRRSVRGNCEVEERDGGAGGAGMAAASTGDDQRDYRRAEGIAARRQFRRCRFETGSGRSEETERGFKIDAGVSRLDAIAANGAAAG